MKRCSLTKIPKHFFTAAPFIPLLVGECLRHLQQAAVVSYCVISSIVAKKHLAFMPFYNVGIINNACVPARDYGIKHM